MPEMRPRKINVRLGITKNLGNYESLRLDYEMSVELSPGDKPSEAIDKTRDWLASKMAKDLASSNGGRDLLIPKE